jgi:MurNAc alpha-1-phosphate uridylyltransferase
LKAIVLAAGRGERLRPLTDATPKPLLPAGGRPLIEWQVEALVRAGIADIVVNHAHLGEQIVAALGDGRRFGARIAYSPEPVPLETAGGIARALPLLGDEPFASVSSDINTDFDYASLHAVARDIAADPARRAAHFVLVENPDWHPGGDMGLRDGRITRDKPWLTYGGVAVFHPAPFRDLDPGRPLRLFPWIHALTDEGRITGEVHRGAWDNVGTADQLAALDRRLSR